MGVIAFVNKRISELESIKSQNMRIIFIFVVLVFALGACKGNQPEDTTDIIVSVRGRALSRSEVKAMVPKEISSVDSLLFAENYVRKWVTDMLVYDVASQNLGDEKEEVDKLVEDYRHSLVRYRYQERLVEERLRSDIQESDKLSYYEKNQEKFILEDGLIKGLFLKVLVDAPGIADVKRWCRSTDMSAVEKIEKYSVQNASIYEYFYDKWVDLDEVLENIPLHVSNTNVFLKSNKFVEVKDSVYCYFLNIKEYIPSGKVEPYEYASSRITEMLVNQRKVDFLRKFEDELYNDAIRGGDVEFHSKP